MGRIRILPDNLINQIAAGEVIERPASVVKELVENALDAGAGRVTVWLEQGGSRKIVVEDDGTGMDADDLLMALERHATSKIAREGDLFSIDTLGFRGEAIPSIASVSRFTLASRTRDAAEGGRIVVSGGRYAAVEPCGLAPGTRVEVADLFFNLPARRKFLRSPATELSHVIVTLEHYALARPDAAFRLHEEGRDILNLPPAKTLEERFFALFPDFGPKEFSRVSFSSPSISVEGLAGRPERNVGTARYQFTLVNGRFVRDRVLQHAVREAYEETHPRGRHPILCLSMRVPPSKVDVNVHPAKREVRFRESGAVHDGVVRALRGAIAPGASSGGAPSHGAPAGSLPPYGFRTHPGGASDTRTAGEAPGLWRAASTPETGGMVGGASPLRALCQWRASFILCDSPTGLAIVDQHVAHERIRYEQLKRFLEEPGPRQPFLTPRTYKLPLQVRPLAREVAELLDAQGFEAEVFGEGVIAVRSAPAFLTEGEAEDLLTEFAEAAGEVLKTPRDRWKEVLIMRSCRGSVMLRDPLTLEKMQYLLDTLYGLGAPLTCPHGRPIVFHLTEAEILSRFGRK